MASMNGGMIPLYWLLGATVLLVLGGEFLVVAVAVGGTGLCGCGGISGGGCSAGVFSLGGPPPVLPPPWVQFPNV